MTSTITNQENQQRDINNVDQWIPTYVFQSNVSLLNDDSAEFVTDTQRQYIRENAPYAKYTFGALVKRSTVRLRTMFRKTFGEASNWQTVERQEMINRLFEELYKYHADFDKLMGIHPETGRMYIRGMVRQNDGNYFFANHSQALNTKFDARGRKSNVPQALRDMLIFINENDEEIRDKYSLIARQFEGIAMEEYGVTLYPQSVRAILTVKAQ